MSLRIAVDSDMLRNLAAFYNLTKDGKVIKYNSSVHNEHINQNLEDYLFLFSYIKQFKIEILVGPVVYNEIKHLDNITNFVEKYCHLTNPDKNKVKILAKAYSSPYMDKGKTLYQPMEKIYVAAIDSYVPSNDCFIMAEATVNECFLLTNNLKDFIFDNKLGDTDNHRRVEGIRIINTQHKYKRILQDNIYFIPQPVSFSKLIKQLKKKAYKTLSYTPNSANTKTNNEENIEL